jgi:hypothetical protein
MHATELGMLKLFTQLAEADATLAAYCNVDALKAALGLGGQWFFRF